MDELSQLLTNTCKKIKDEKQWKNVSRIVGESVEDCVVTMMCPICNEKALEKYKTNEKSKDVQCKSCNCQIQIKATKNTKKKQTSLKLLGAEYKTTCSSIKENNVHYLVVLYSFVGDTYTINDILFIDKLDINESCIIPRNPLSSTARRAGWQGCTLVFNTFKSISLKSSVY
jgi:type II restriction enzyme